MRVLLIEDHQLLARALKQGLTEEGITVDHARDPEDGDSKALSANYDVIILDSMLPNRDGLELLQSWRRAGVQSHVLVLTASGSLEDKVKSLDGGADDCLTKPFQFDELLARLRALDRRRRAIPDQVIRLFDLEIHTGAHVVKRAGKPIHLTPREFSVLQYLVGHRGQVVTRSMIWEHLYEAQDERTSNAVAVYIRYLRRKIDDGFEPPLILTRSGEGYLLRGEEARFRAL